jgi:hypothetical protein
MRRLLQLPGAPQCLCLLAPPDEGRQFICPSHPRHDQAHIHNVQDSSEHRSDGWSGTASSAFRQVFFLQLPLISRSGQACCSPCNTGHQSHPTACVNVKIPQPEGFIGGGAGAGSTAPLVVLCAPFSRQHVRAEWSAAGAGDGGRAGGEPSQQLVVTCPSLTRPTSRTPCQHPRRASHAVKHIEMHFGAHDCVRMSSVRAECSSSSCLQAYRSIFHARQFAGLPCSRK